MRIIFIRHAESIANASKRMQGHADYSLSNMGIEEAKKLQDRFYNEKLIPTHIYSSPLSRTFQTASIVCKNWKIEIKKWEKIIEHDVGVFSNLTWPEIESKFGTLIEGFDKGINWDLVDGAESYLDMSERANLVMEFLFENHSDEDTILIFTHGGIMQHLISAILKSNIVCKINIPNTAIFDFDFDKTRWIEKGFTQNNPAYFKVNRFCDASHITKEEILNDREVL
ncbi:MAG: hypothetical protein CL758_03110 [Chloroflexi bacterium]|nr:hypothetical protein [Chloroflexota bacterium]|tara:strand:- start:1362 stop:2039 length:678 start_codon:yes stop_codon:yes gene_type:complete